MNEQKQFDGFDRPNYTQAPNQFFDDLVRQIDDLSELKVTLTAIRQTFGYHRNRAPLSVSFLEVGTGLSRNSVKRGLELAIQHGTLKKVQSETRSEPAVYEISMSEQVRTYNAGETDWVGGSVADPQPLTPGGSVADPQPLTPGGSAADPQPLTPGGSAADPQPLTPINKVLKNKESKERESAPPSPYQKRKAIERSEAVLTFKHYAGFSPPPAWRAAIADTVGLDPGSQRLWEEICKAGSAKSWRDVNAYLDWFKRGEVPTNGRPRAAPAPPPADKRKIESLSVVLERKRQLDLENEAKRNASSKPNVNPTQVSGTAPPGRPGV